MDNQNQDSPSSPSLADFSKEATKKAVRKAAREQWLTFIPVALAPAGALALWLFDFHILISLCLAGSLPIGIGNFAVNYFLRANILANRYLQRLNERLVAKREASLKTLEHELRESAKAVKGAEEYATQGAQHHQMIRKKLDAIHTLLSRKLNTNELMYLRYIGTVEQMGLAIIDNLRQIASLLQSIREIDEDYIAARLQILASLKNPAEADKNEVKTLETRRQLRAKQLDKINDILTINEEAMTDLDTLAAAVAEMKEIETQAEMSLEDIRKDAEELMRRSEKYRRVA